MAEEEEGGVAFMFTSFGMVRGVLLFKTALSLSLVAFWCLLEKEEDEEGEEVEEEVVVVMVVGVLSLLTGCPCSLR